MAGDTADPTNSPATSIPPDSRESQSSLEEGVALCLSGGGYRAMLFHLGSLWRLNDAGLLPKLARISSVSGGSITAGVLGWRWKSLEFAANGVAQQFSSEIVSRVRRLADRTIDEGAIIAGILSPDTISEKVVKAYRKHLFEGNSPTLQDLPPDPPRFVINATNVQSGALWRFMRPYMRDYRVGEVKNPTTELAIAIAASCTFPPVLSPLRLELPDGAVTAPDDGTEDLHFPPYTTDIQLTDGGVYDNIGIETAWKRYATILVSDSGGKMEAEAEPKTDWARHALRINDLIDNQVRSLRKRQVIDSYKAGVRKGTYWGIRTNIADYGLQPTLECPFEKTILLAGLRTRLKRLDAKVQEQVINWGYAVCDAALRRHVDTDIPIGTFPYPDVGVG